MFQVLAAIVDNFRLSFNLHVPGSNDRGHIVLGLYVRLSLPSFSNPVTFDLYKSSVYICNIECLLKALSADTNSYYFMILSLWPARGVAFHRHTLFSSKYTHMDVSGVPLIVQGIFCICLFFKVLSVSKLTLQITFAIC